MCDTSTSSLGMGSVGQGIPLTIPRISKSQQQSLTSGLPPIPLMYRTGSLVQNNRTAGSGTYGIPNVVHGYDGTRVGTFFEKNILKACNLFQVGSKSSMVDSSLRSYADSSQTQNGMRFDRGL